MTFNPFQKPKSLSEMEEDTDRLNAEDEHLGMQVSIAKKKLMIKELGKRGLTAKHFNFDWAKILQWLKTH